MNKRLLQQQPARSSWGCPGVITEKKLSAWSKKALKKEVLKEGRRAKELGTPRKDSRIARKSETVGTKRKGTFYEKGEQS